MNAIKSALCAGVVVLLTVFVTGYLSVAIPNWRVFFNYIFR